VTKSEIWLSLLQNAAKKEERLSTDNSDENNDGNAAGNAMRGQATGHVAGTSGAGEERRKRKGGPAEQIWPEGFLFPFFLSKLKFYTKSNEF
jgi:hypothetical protein